LKEQSLFLQERLKKRKIKRLQEQKEGGGAKKTRKRSEEADFEYVDVDQ
jgi:hypothetical protein